MKAIIVSVLLVSLFPQQTQIVEPKVTHHDEVQPEQHRDRVEITCPAGYEPHLVVPNPGFDMSIFNGMAFGFNEGAEYYTLCFDKKMMDSVSKNKDLRRWVVPPRAV